MRPIVFCALLATPAMADAPKVVTDIPPVNSLVAQVMKGVGTPKLLLEKGASPHHYAMRPSDARAISDADMVIWMGHALSTWMEEPIETLATDATILELLDTEGWPQRAFDHEGDHHDAHDHADDHAEGGDHDHKDDHGHDDHKDSHDHADHSDHHDGHDHGDFDPHAWLSPVAAKAWLGQIAEALAAQDPENAAQYSSNAAQAVADLASLDDEVAAILGPVRGEILLPHDAYGYFIDHWDLPEYAFIAGGHGQKPGASRIMDLRAEISEGHIACTFGDLETNPDWLDLITEGSDLEPGTLDIMGWDHPEGPDRYRLLMLSLAQAFATCR